MNESQSLALVTGASSGIGMVYARELLKQGFDVIAVGRRKERLEELAAEFPHRRVDAVVADLSTVEGVETLSEICRTEPLTLLVNNAGVSHYMSFVNLPVEKARELMNIKVLAPTLLAHAALPGMLKRGKGTVVNVAGMLAFGATAPLGKAAGRATYVSTLAHLVNLTLALHEEFQNTGVNFQVLCPGVVATEFHERQGMDLSAFPRMTPEKVVEASLKSLQRNEVVCAPGVEDNQLIAEALKASLAAFQGQSPQLASRYQYPPLRTLHRRPFTTFYWR